MLHKASLIRKAHNSNDRTMGPNCFGFLRHFQVAYVDLMGVIRYGSIGASDVDRDPGV